MGDKAFHLTFPERHDYHIHSVFCGHADRRMSVECIVEQARSRGLEEIAITEHVQMESGWTDSYLRAVSEASRGLRVIAGFEAKVLDRRGELDIEPGLARRHLVIGSFHTFEPAGDYLEALLCLARNPHVDIIGHLGLLNGSAFDLSESEEDRALDAIVANDKIVELNARYDLPDPRVVRKLLARRARLCFGSDAHAPEEIGANSLRGEVRRKLGEAAGGAKA